MKKSFWTRSKESLWWMLVLLGIMFALELINSAMGNKLSAEIGGITPRTWGGLAAIFSAPFLHHGLAHFFINCIPFAILGGLVCLEDKRLFVKLTLFGSFFGGLGVWFFGRSSVHAGSSLLIFSYFGFLNKRNQRKENDEAIEFMKSLKVPMFKSSLSDVKALARPYTYETVMDSAEGKKRFEPFFKEFIKKFEL